MRYLASEHNAILTVRQAVAMGINHLETARGYGKSEQYLGAALSAGLPVERTRLHITTKIPPVADAGEMERCLDQSLDRLGLDWADCLAIHGVNTREHLDLLLSPKGCMQAVRQAVADGRVRHVGF